MRSIDSEDEEEDEFPSGPDDSSGSEAVLAWAEVCAIPNIKDGVVPWVFRFVIVHGGGNPSGVCEMFDGTPFRRYTYASLGQVQFLLARPTIMTRYESSVPITELQFQIEAVL